MVTLAVEEEATIASKLHKEGIDPLHCVVNQLQIPSLTLSVRAQ